MKINFILCTNRPGNTLSLPTPDYRQKCQYNNNIYTVQGEIKGEQFKGKLQNSGRMIQQQCGKCTHPQIADRYQRYQATEPSLWHVTGSVIH